MGTADDLSQLAATVAQLAQTMAERDTETDPPPPPGPGTPERVMLTAEQAADRLGIGRTLMYRLIRSGDIYSVRIGRLRRVPAAAVHDYATQLTNETTNAAA